MLPTLRTIFNQVTATVGTRIDMVVVYGIWECSERLLIAWLIKTFKNYLTMRTNAFYNVRMIRKGDKTNKCQWHQSKWQSCWNKTALWKLGKSDHINGLRIRRQAKQHQFLITVKTLQKVPSRQYLNRQGLNSPCLSQEAQLVNNPPLIEVGACKGPCWLV